MKRNQHKMLALAISISSSGHVDQLDKGGNAYILHPLRLMMRLRTDDAELMQIAVLHDVIEDCVDWTISKLRALGFSDRVLTALTLLTHKVNETYMSYIKAIGTNKDATKVKLEDLRDNSCATRLKGMTEKDQARIVKYHTAYTYLKGL